VTVRSNLRQQSLERTELDVIDGPKPVPHCSILLSQTDRPGLAPFDDKGYPFTLIALSANRMKLGPGGSRGQEMSRPAFVVIK
jgi:hypothetical protein